MNLIVHNLDPDADAVMILKNPNVEFAPWSPTELERCQGEPVAEQLDFRQREPSSEPVPDLEPSWEPSPGPSPEPSPERMPEEYESDFILEDAILEPEPEPEPEQEPIHQECVAEVHFYVSSRHLILASPKFKCMLSGGKWKEGTRNAVDGRYHISAQEWDIEALLIVLKAIHCRNREVPRKVSLEMLAKIVVLIDYYKCAEVLELFTEIWVKHAMMASPVPSYLCRDLMLWMCIAWVLRIPQVFEKTTTVAVRRTKCELPTLELPITVCVTRIEKLRTEARRQTIGIALSQLQQLLQEFEDPQYQCPSGDSFECGSMLYGALRKEMKLQGLLPVPTAPFSGLGISELYYKLQSIRSPSWSRPSTMKRTSRHGCHLGGKVMAIAELVTREPDGLKLQDFDLD